MKGIPIGIPAKGMKEEGEPASAFGGTRPPLSDSDFKTRQTPLACPPRPDPTHTPPNPGPAAQSAPQRKTEGNPATPRAVPVPVSTESESGALFGRAADAKTTRQDAERAARLRAFALEMGWEASNNRRKGAEAFGVLRREREIAGSAPDLIDRVLDALISGRIDYPKIRNGRELIQQWGWVLRATGLDKSPPPSITPAARKVADRVLTRNWPFPDNDVYALAQLSMDAINSFWDRLDAFPKLTSPRTGEPIKLFGSLTCLLGELQFQTEKHLSDVVENLAHKRGEFRGAGDSLVWAPDRHQFARDAARLCKEWQWPGGWPALLAAITGKPGSKQKGS